MRGVGLRIIPPTPLMRWNRRQVALTWSLAVLTAVAVIPSVWVVRELFDTWIPAGNKSAALVGCTGLFVIRALGSALTVWQRRASMRLAKDAAAELRKKMVRRVLGADPRSIDQWVPARMQARIVHDSERVDVMLNRLTSVVLPAAAMTVLAGLGMVYVSPLLAATGLAVVIGAVATHRWQTARVRKKTKSFQEAFESYAASTAFLVRHTELIKGRGFEDGEARRQGGVIGQLRDRGKAMANAHVEAGQIQYLVVGLVAVVALLVGAQQVIAGTSSVGNLAAFYFAATLLTGAIAQISSARGEVVAGRLAVERLTELWESLPPSESSSAPAVVPGTAVRVELQDVSVTYGDRVILDGVDLRLRAGEHVDIGGPNGAGKTTLLRVLLGVLAPTSGRVLVDGRDPSGTAGETVRRRMGWASQRPTFFDGTIAENLTYGRPGEGLDEVLWALDVVGLADFVDSLPDGVHSAMGDDGVRLSGGEAQRASIARALIGHPDVVVLDEPGNHLPPAELTAILSTIRHQLPHSTILTAGHAKASALQADRALLLRNGVIEELAVHG
jgi:ABC-type multidrug transport system fused ATPase/permease subunit